MILHASVAGATEVTSPQGEVVVIESLVRDHHLAIGIESASAVYDADRMDLPGHLNLPATWRPPRLVEISVEVEGSASEIAHAVASHVTQADGAFRYRVEDTSAGPVLVPAQRRSASGDWTDVSVLLDTSVSLPSGPAPVGQLVQSVIDQLDAAGFEALVPTGTPYAHEVVQGAGRTLSARDALADIYRQTRNDIVWSHRIGLSGDKHALNFIRVGPPTPDEWDLGWESPEEIRQLIEASKADVPPWDVEGSR